MAGEKSLPCLCAELRCGCVVSAAQVRTLYQVQHRSAHDTVRTSFSLTEILFSLPRLFVLGVARLVQPHRARVILPDTTRARIQNSRSLENPA